MSDRYEPTQKDIKALVAGLRRLWTKYERNNWAVDGIDQDTLTERLERLLYMTGVMQE
tara:strand:+ start:263 stop:436 length:174 start_codon:yes stop_codon:yes gene_type:complete